MNWLRVFAKQFYGVGRPGDVSLGISASGNSKNAMSVIVGDRILGMKVIGFTGAKDRELADGAEVAVKVLEWRSKHI